MPSLTNLLDYIKTEGANLIWIIMIGVAIRFLSKQEWVRMVVFLIGAGATFYIVQNPQTVGDALQQVSSKLFGGLVMLQ